MLAPRWDQLVSGVLRTRSVGPSLRENAQKISRERQMTAPEGTDIEIARVDAVQQQISSHDFNNVEMTAFSGGPDGGAPVR
ncbi:MAG: hypothetical protein QF637_01945 [Acidimicrobiales bacterium]|nr:hypothetical protein [Acidimicrobiales bacterium]